MSEAQPGDLIFYMDKTGYIHHVVMYAGDRKTVEAKGRAYGIVSDDVSSTACWAVRLLEEETEEVSEFEKAFQRGVAKLKKNKG